MKAIDKIISVINKICLTVAVCLLVFLCVSIVAQIVVRKMGGTLIWVDEMTRYAFMWLVLFGTVEVAKTGGHITIVSFLEMLPKMVQKILNGIIYLVVTGFSCILTYAYVRAITIYASQRFSVVTAIPMSFHYVLISVLMALIAIESFLYSIRCFSSVREHEGGETA